MMNDADKAKVADFLRWVEDQPPAGQYTFFSVDNCAVAQYLNDKGLIRDPNDDRRWRLWSFLHDANPVGYSLMDHRTWGDLARGIRRRMEAADAQERT